MKTQVQFKQADGDQGIALLVGSITSLEQAKRELSNQLNLPEALDSLSEHEAVDTRLRDAGIDPDSVSYSQVAE